MKLTNENILIASLLGSKYVEQIPRLAMIENELNKHVIEPVSIIPFKTDPDEIYIARDFEKTDLWQNDKPLSADKQFFPLYFLKSADQGEWWQFPYEPMIAIETSVKQENSLPASFTMNHIGTIKGKRSLNDYQITITGGFLGKKMRGRASETYPRYDVEKLLSYCLAPEAIKVRSEPLQILGINQISIESFSFPFTKGESVQAFEIKAKSDFPYELDISHPSVSLETGTP